AYERPFGNAVVDGFDFDIEKGHGLRYSEVARTLRRMMDADKTKQYYLTASPQCFFPDALISDAMEKIPFDAAFIQFYNNPCHAHSWNKNSNHMTNDAFNWGMWHNWATTKSMNKNIKLFLTVPLSPAMASNGKPYSPSQRLSHATILTNFQVMSLAMVQSIFSTMSSGNI